MKNIIEIGSGQIMEIDNESIVITTTPTFRYFLLSLFFALIFFIYRSSFPNWLPWFVLIITFSEPFFRNKIIIDLKHEVLKKKKYFFNLALYEIFKINYKKMNGVIQSTLLADMGGDTVENYYHIEFYDNVTKEKYLLILLNKREHVILLKGLLEKYLNIPFILNEPIRN